MDRATERSPETSQRPNLFGAGHFWWGGEWESVLTASATVGIRVDGKRESLPVGARVRGRERRLAGLLGGRRPPGCFPAGRGPARAVRVRPAHGLRQGLLPGPFLLRPRAPAGRRSHRPPHAVGCRRGGSSCGLGPGCRADPPPGRRRELGRGGGGVHRDVAVDAPWQPRWRGDRHGRAQRGPPGARPAGERRRPGRPRLPRGRGIPAHCEYHGATVATRRLSAARLSRPGGRSGGAPAVCRRLPAASAISGLRSPRLARRAGAGRGSRRPGPTRRRASHRSAVAGRGRPRGAGCPRVHSRLRATVRPVGPEPVGLLSRPRWRRWPTPTSLSGCSSSAPGSERGKTAEDLSRVWESSATDCTHSSGRSRPGAGHECGPAVTRRRRPRRGRRQ